MAEGRTGRRETKGPRWEATRARVVRRDGGICWICGQPGADSADHVIPLAYGGTSDDDNLRAVHHKVEPRCNIVKKHRTVDYARERLGLNTRRPEPKVSRRW